MVFLAASKFAPARDLGLPRSAGSLYDRPNAEPIAETQREVESLRHELLQLKDGSGELTAVECRAFAEKVVELTVKGQTGAAADMARTMIDAMRPEMEKECREKGTRPEIECALRVNSLDELERCDASKTGGKVKAGGVGVTKLVR